MTLNFNLIRKAFVFGAAAVSFSSVAHAGGGGFPRADVMFECERGVKIAWDNVHTYVIFSSNKALSGVLAEQWNFTPTSSEIKFPGVIFYRANAGFARGTKGVLELGKGRKLACTQTFEGR